MKALSDPNRVKIIKALQQKYMCVCELQAALKLAQPTVSKHLKTLEAAGLLLGRPGSEGLIASQWVSGLVGGNSLWANLFASVVGAFMYFATLTEVPILQGLLGAGMGKKGRARVPQPSASRRLRQAFCTQKKIGRPIMTIQTANPNDVKILILASETCAYPGANSVGQSHSSYPANTYILRVRSPVLFPEKFYLDCFEKGIGRIIIMSCGEECPCDGAFHALAKRFDTVYQIMKRRGLDIRRLRLTAICTVCIRVFLKEVNMMNESVQELGPPSQEMEAARARAAS